MNPVRDPIDRHFETLAPEVASAGFTDKVMEQIAAAAAERQQFGWIRPAWVVAIASVAVIVIGIFLLRVSPAENGLRTTRSTQLAEMRRQHALLKEELGNLRTRAQDAAPVIYLGSVGEVDYVWDLSPLLERRIGRALPSSFREISTPQFARELP